MPEVSNKRWHLYVLRLEDGKFYVGITSKTPEIRMQEHLAGVRVAYWTAKHKPIEIIRKEDLGVIDKAKAEKYENRVTRALMKQRGINNVRGGDLTDTKDYIQRFGYIYDKEVWGDVVASFLVLLLIALFLIDKYIVVIFPGGIR